MTLKAELKILDPRLPGWGFPHYGSSLAAGLDLHACIDAPILLRPQAPAVLISAGIAFRIGDPEWSQSPSRRWWGGWRCSRHKLHGSALTWPRLEKIS